MQTSWILDIYEQFFKGDIFLKLLRMQIAHITIHISTVSKAVSRECVILMKSFPLIHKLLLLVKSEKYFLAILYNTVQLCILGSIEDSHELLDFSSAAAGYLVLCYSATLLIDGMLYVLCLM